MTASVDEIRVSFFIFSSCAPLSEGLFRLSSLIFTTEPCAAEVQKLLKWRLRTHCWRLFCPWDLARGQRTPVIKNHKGYLHFKGLSVHREGMLETYIEMVVCVLSDDPLITSQKSDRAGTGAGRWCRISTIGKEHPARLAWSPPPDWNCCLTWMKVLFNRR